ncbi:MAG TPA: hypothetical protein DGT23_01595 [Micromonosporaceae bacterium]|nr:hypothetical protein [Micromonosporaceae bacterium]
MTRELSWRELSRRWVEGDGPILANEVLSRLIAGQDLGTLPLDIVDGRFDLRGLAVPKPQASAPRTYTVKMPDGVQFTQTWVSLGGLIEFKNVRLEDLDLRAADLPHLRFFHTTIANCRFDRAGCQDWRLWASEVTSCSFVGADLSDLSVGAFHDGRSNRLVGNDFTRANLSGSRTRYWGVADVIDCDFSHARIVDVNFFQASLIRCTFAGTLRDVIFDGRVLEPERKTVGNPMEEIDMSGVTAFEDVDFRGVNFDRINLPQDPNLIVVRDPEWVNRALAALAGRADIPADIVRGRLESKQKYDQPNCGHHFVNLTRITDNEARELMRQLLKDAVD